MEESRWNIFEPSLKLIWWGFSHCLEILVTHYSCNSLKCVWELTKEVKQMSFSIWILSLLYCLYVEVALKMKKPACVNADFDNAAHWRIKSLFCCDSSRQFFGLKIKPLRVPDWCTCIFWIIWGIFLLGMGECQHMPHHNWDANLLPLSFCGGKKEFSLGRNTILTSLIKARKKAKHFRPTVTFERMLKSHVAV